MCLEIAVLTIHSYVLASPLEAKNAIGDGETRGLNHLGFLHLSLDHGFESAIGVCYQQCLQCHPDLTTQTDQGVPDNVDDTKKKYT